MGKEAEAYLSALVTSELIPDHAGVIREHVEKGEVVSDGPELRWESTLALLKLGYSDSNTNQIIENLYEQSWADDESLIYLESNECLDKLVSPKYQLIRDSKAGNVYYGILKLTTQSSKK